MRSELVSEMTIAPPMENNNNNNRYRSVAKFRLKKCFTASPLGLKVQGVQTIESTA